MILLTGILQVSGLDHSTFSGSPVWFFAGTSTGNALPSEPRGKKRWPVWAIGGHLRRIGSVPREGNLNLADGFRTVFNVIARKLVFPNRIGHWVTIAGWK